MLMLRQACGPGGSSQGMWCSSSIAAIGLRLFQYICRPVLLLLSAGPDKKLKLSLK